LIRLKSLTQRGRGRKRLGYDRSFITFLNVRRVLLTIRLGSRTRQDLIPEWKRGRDYNNDRNRLKCNLWRPLSRVSTPNAILFSDIRRAAKRIPRIICLCFHLSNITSLHSGIGPFRLVYLPCHRVRFRSTITCHRVLLYDIFIIIYFILHFIELGPFSNGYVLSGYRLTQMSPPLLAY
jgi:hypothetical protein